MSRGGATLWGRLANRGRPKEPQELTNGVGGGRGFDRSTGGGIAPEPGRGADLGGGFEGKGFRRSGSGAGWANAPDPLPGERQPGLGASAAVRDEHAVLERVRDRFVATGMPVTPANVATTIRAEGRALGDSELLAMTRRLAADLSGAGPLEGLLTAGVTDVLVNGPEQVWVDSGDGLRRVHEVRFDSADEVRRLAQRLAFQAGRRLDAAAPYVDARLPNGARFHAVLPPIAPEGACLSLRMPPAKVFDLGRLAACGTLTACGADLLRALIAHRVPFLVSGGTGTGKTTLLSSLLSLVHPGERIVLAEDSPELRPEHPHVVRLQTRPANIEGSGEVSLESLVRQGLRMRPDRLVVGEARGPEIVSLLSALNTGHEGGAGTLHANGAEEVPARVEAMGCAAGLDRGAVHSQLAATRVLLVHLVRDSRGRRLSEVRVLERDAAGLVRAVPAVAFTPEGRRHEYPGVAEVISRLGRGWRG